MTPDGKGIFEGNTMVVDEKTRQALDLNCLQLPARPLVIKLEAEDYTDSTGESSLRILVLLDEKTDVDKLSGEDVGELKSTIRQSLRDHGINVCPYIFLAKPSALADTKDDEE